MEAPVMFLLAEALILTVKATLAVWSKLMKLLKL